MSDGVNVEVNRASGEWPPEEFGVKESHLKRNFILVIFFAFVVPAIFVAAFNLGLEPNTYPNTWLGFIAVHPKGWDVEEVDVGDFQSVVFSKQGEGAIVVSTMWSPAFFDLNDFVVWEHEWLEESGYDNYSILSESSYTMAQTPAYELILDFWIDNNHYKQKEVTILRTTTVVTVNRAYVVICESRFEKYDNWSPAFEEFIQSFEFI